LLNIIYELSNLSNDMKLSTQKNILFQVGIIKLCNNNVTLSNSNNTCNYNFDSKDVDELKRRIAMLENEIRNIKNIKGTNPTMSNQMTRMETREQEPKREERQEIKKEDISNIKTTGKGIGAWKKIVDDFKQEGKIMLYTNLINSNASEINDMTIGISFPKGLTPFGKTVLEKNENITEIEKRVSMEYGKPMKIKYINGAQSNIVENQVNPIESFSQDMDIPFNIVE